MKCFIWIDPINLNCFKNYTKEYNICIIKISERDEKEGKSEKNTQKIMTENFPNLGKKMNMYGYKNWSELQIG